MFARHHYRLNWLHSIQRRCQHPILSFAAFLSQLDLCQHAFDGFTSDAGLLFAAS